MDYTDRLDRPDSYDSAAWRLYTTQKLAAVTIQVKEPARETGARSAAMGWAQSPNGDGGRQPESAESRLAREQTPEGAAWPRDLRLHRSVVQLTDRVRRVAWARNGYGGEVTFTTTSHVVQEQPLIVTTRTEQDGLPDTADGNVNLHEQRLGGGRNLERGDAGLGLR